MNGNSDFGKRRFALSSVGSFPLETVEYVDHLELDGRIRLIDAFPERAGGMPKYAAKGVRYFDPTADVALAGLIGDLDADVARAAVRELRCCTDCLFPVSGKTTNRSRVTCDDQKRMIVRIKQDISFENDLHDERRGELAALVAQSASCLLGNLPLSLTHELIQQGRDAGTYMALGAGGRQLGQIDRFQPHALCLNFEEAKLATGLNGGSPKTVFAALVARCRADHAVIMTGGGEYPIFVADMLMGETTPIEPISVKTVSDRRSRVNCLGTGDVLAGVVTFFTGLCERWPTGDDLLDIVRFARDVCLLHLTQSASLREKVQADYSQLRARLMAGAAEVPAPDRSFAQVA